MADWTAPFHLPKFTDDEFEKAKDKYNQDHGYTISVPAWDDIIHFKRRKPMTEDEKYLWTHKRKGEIPIDRLEELETEKANARRKYIARLASPSPKIVRDAGSVLTAIDDLQDAVSTLACIGMITAAVAGGATAAALAGPLGWVVGASTLLQAINPYSRLRGGKGKALTGRAAKKQQEKLTDKNPFSKKARAKVAANISKFRPSVGNAIEALQVTDNIFGVGISLGPIMGFVQDLAIGAVRKISGEKVDIKLPRRTMTRTEKVAARSMRGIGQAYGEMWESDTDDEILTMFAALLAIQVLVPYLEEYNPFAEVENLSDYEVEALRPTNPLILEILAEHGQTADDAQIWPQNGKRWISYVELQEITAPLATRNLQVFAQKNKNDVAAFIAGQCAHDFALSSIEAIEGKGTVKIEYSHIERIILIILDQGWCYPDDITDAQVKKFEDWCYVHEYLNTTPNHKEIWNYAQTWCGFTWAKSPDEIR